MGRSDGSGILGRDGSGWAPILSFFYPFVFTSLAKQRGPILV
jgi:hypothetical protein